MLLAAAWKSRADLIVSGWLNSMNPSADPASLPYVDRFLVNATGTPPTVPRCVTMPSLVRSATSVYDPAGADEPRLEYHALCRSSFSIGVQVPRKRYDVDWSVGVPPPGSHSRTAYVSVMAWPADVALHE